MPLFWWSCLSLFVAPPSDRPRSPLGTSQAEPSPADTEYEDKPKPEFEPEAEPAAADGPVTEPGLRAGTGQERTQRLEDEGGPAAHPTVLLLSGVTQGERSLTVVHPAVLGKLCYVLCFTSSTVHKKCVPWSAATQSIQKCPILICISPI